MISSKTRKLLIVALFAAACIVVGGNSAQAWCGGFGYSSCYHSCYYSWYPSCHHHHHHHCCWCCCCCCCWDHPVPSDPIIPEDPKPDPNAGSTIGSMTGTLAIHVPEDADVTINGLKTKATGSHRKYVSENLRQGYKYEYDVRASVVRDGRVIERRQVVYLIPGRTEQLALDFVPSTSVQLASTE